MKLNDQIFEQDGKMVHKRTFDPTPQIEFNAAAQSAGLGHKGENRHLGRVPMWLVGEWLKEAGVAWDDPAADDVLRRKLLDGEFSKLRNWQGTF